MDSVKYYLARTVQDYLMSAVGRMSLFEGCKIEVQPISILQTQVKLTPSNGVPRYFTVKVSEHA